MSLGKSLLAAPAVLAAFSMTAMPVAAAPLPASSEARAAERTPGWSEADGVQHQYRRWHHRRDRGIDGGDIVAGVLILGGIAAIASAVSRNNEQPRERYPASDRLPRDSYRDGYRSGDGLGNAADMCVQEIERERRVQNVDQVQRLASGWVVTGTTFDGENFVCTIGQTGRIETIEYAGGARSRGYSVDDEAYDREEGDDYYASRDTAVEDRQYDDDRYAAERARMGSEGAAEDRSDEPQPAYPGGPLPGDDDRPLYDYDGN